MSKIAILIPCYNEDKTIQKVIEDYRQRIPSADIYVYDNNSTDETWTIAQEAGAHVKREPRQGKGNVVRTMFRDVDADVYLLVDGDDTYPAEYAPALVAPILEGEYDMVVGDRLSSTYFSENKRRFHNVGNKLVCAAINFFWPSERPVRDVMSGLRALSPVFVKSFPALSRGFEIETEMTIHALDKNLLVTSIPVPYRDRAAGSQSKLNTFVDGRNVLLTIFNLYREYKPLQLFGMLALGLFCIAFFLFIPIFEEYLHTGLVPRFPTLIISAASATVSLLLLICGFVLDAIARSSKKSFEIQINAIKLLLDNKKYRV